MKSFLKNLYWTVEFLIFFLRKVNFKQNITDGSRYLVGNSGCAAFCVLRDELKFDQNFLLGSAYNTGITQTLEKYYIIHIIPYIVSLNIIYNIFH